MPTVNPGMQKPLRLAVLTPRLSPPKKKTPSKHHVHYICQGLLSQIICWQGGAIRRTSEVLYAADHAYDAGEVRILLMMHDDDNDT
jgi:hypothetical protein